MEINYLIDFIDLLKNVSQPVAGNASRTEVLGSKNLKQLMNNKFVHDVG